MNFDHLVSNIQQTNNHLQQESVKAVNMRITLRNWLVGFYIVEFEQHGEDRAAYGSYLLNTLAEQLVIKGLTAPELSRCRQFYQIYPKLIGSFVGDLRKLIPDSILGLPSQELQNNENQDFMNLFKEMVLSISYSHFVELIKIQDDVKRNFYELLILKTQPSVKELKRQISSLTFERTGLSGNYESAMSEIQHKITPVKTSDLVKTHYFFEFLNLSQDRLIEENELEQGLIDHLQQFILELGDGFCFEARQKRILIGGEHYFIDLVFYHRILKCHVIIELKTEKANYEHIGQLKTYLNYYKKHICLEHDNPPVGILLVTDQNKPLVEYAVADSDQELFVSEYVLQLPDKEKFASFICNELLQR